MRATTPSAAEDEQQAGRVETHHQQPKGQQRAEPILADGEGHGAESAERRQSHDQPDDAEQHLRQSFDEAQHARAARPQALQRESEEHGDEQNLQYLPFGEGIDHRGRNDVEQETDRRLQFSGARKGCDGPRVESAHIDVHPAPGPDDVDHRETHEQRHRAHDFEIDQRKPAGLPTFFMSSTPAIPVTTVQKITGAISILMSLMNPSPRGFIIAPACG